MAPSAWRTRPDGVELTLRVTPNAAGNFIGGIETRTGAPPALRLRVTAPPDGGRANRAVIAMLATHLGVPKSAITLIAGEKSRDKLVLIAGEPGTILPALIALTV
jgi:uncharacterized protein (TIGR00251 family)